MPVLRPEEHNTNMLCMGEVPKGWFPQDVLAPMNRPTAVVRNHFGRGFLQHGIRSTRQRLSAPGLVVQQVLVFHIAVFPSMAWANAPRHWTAAEPQGLFTFQTRITRRIDHRWPGGKARGMAGLRPKHLCLGGRLLAHCQSALWDKAVATSWWICALGCMRNVCGAGVHGLLCGRTLGGARRSSECITCRPTQAGCGSAEATATLASDGGARWYLACRCRDGHRTNML